MSEQKDSLDDQVKALVGLSQKPSLVALAYALRHPETWPEGFVWDYGSCADCAMGLASELWSDRKSPDPDDSDAMRSWIAREMALPLGRADDIFFGLAPIVTKKVKVGWFRSRTEGKPDWDAVYPEDVADAIDRYLASAE